MIGRESKAIPTGDACRLPLKIPLTESGISRHQATLTVANHADGIRVTLATHRAAKNPTRLRKVRRTSTPTPASAHFKRKTHTHTGRGWADRRWALLPRSPLRALRPGGGGGCV